MLFSSLRNLKWNANHSGSMLVINYLDLTWIYLIYVCDSQKVKLLVKV